MSFWGHIKWGSFELGNWSGRVEFGYGGVEFVYGGFHKGRGSV